MALEFYHEKENCQKSNEILGIGTRLFTSDKTQQTIR